MRYGWVVLMALILAPWAGYADDITLVKHAKRPTNQTESVVYTVKPNDTLSLIFMDIYGASAEDMPYLYRKFKELNPQVTNLNYIKADQKLIIPRLRPKPAPSQKDLEVKAVDQDAYVIKQGEHLAQILRRLYGLSDVQIFREYLAAIKELNPGLKDPNHVLPGQKIRFPRKDNGKTNGQTSSQPLERSPSETSQPAPTGAAPGTAAGVSQAAPGTAASSTAASTLGQKPEGTPAAKREEAVPAPVSESAARLIRNTLFPALNQMGGTPKDQGTYFMPITGGGNIAIDTQEIPVMELDTGTRIILDINNKISPELKALIEKAFPNCKVVTNPGADLEAIMDRVLSVSGYFSINKNASPLLVGEEEKLKLSGKWIVYKDYSRHNVFVINILKPQDTKTPQPIRAYAARFGLDIVEMGGAEAPPIKGSAAAPVNLHRSFPALFERLGVDYAQNQEIELASQDKMVRITYRAPLVARKLILAADLPDATIQELLQKKGYVIMRISAAELTDVLAALGIPVEGPPLRITIAADRTELDLPALQTGHTLILEQAIDSDIARYITSLGQDVLIW